MEDIDRLLMKLRDGGVMDHTGAKELAEDLEELRSVLQEGKNVVPIEMSGYKFFDNTRLFWWSGSAFKDYPEIDDLIYDVASEVFSGRFNSQCYQDPKEEAAQAF